ncbi:MAG: OsmC family protein [Chloroflexota bacterium]|nr:OsmC family protein [Chloroflexota bacterium]MBI5702554.1 OsmC family protein [Chloroflexota bacterium]
MKATVVWKENLAFAGETNSGFPIPLDADPEVGGTNSGPRPMELIALGLAGCTAMDVISILRKKRQDVKRFEVRVDAERASEHPKVFTHAVITYVVSGKGVEEAAVLRAIELSATRYCPAQAMLGSVVPMDLRYEIYEEEDGTERLTAQGVWQEAAG